MNFAFKRGVYHLNDQSNFDFQLNRTVMWDGGDLGEIQKTGPQIKTSEDWKRELIALGNRAVSEGRTENAITYYRMSEFFMYDGDSDKKKYYKMATEMFYEFHKDIFASGEVERFEVPYEDIKLPVMVAKAKGEEKDVILLHGGNDSYFEEFFMPMRYLAENGFTVYLFEGPGQGGVMRMQGKHFTHEWERPVKVVIDYSHKCRTIVNLIFHKKAKKDELVRWGLEHGKYAYEAKDAYEYAVKMNRYQMMDIADRITQDILIVGANKDHFIPYTMAGREISALKNVRSLTFRLFTDKENACNHCNCGNVKLVFDTFMDWIMQIKQRDRRD